MRKRFVASIRTLHRENPLLFVIPTMLLCMFAIVPIKRFGLLTEQQALVALVLIPLVFAVGMLLKIAQILRNR